MESGLTLQVGDIVAGKYEVLRKHATGSMSTIYACRQLEFFDRIVALKVLFPLVAKDPKYVARLQREVTASYLVTDPYVVRTYEYIKKNGIIGYSMEYVDGGDLEALLKRAKNLSPVVTAKILFQLSCGIASIHAAGLIHRDIRPANILLKKSGTIKITDLGIVKTSNGPSLTDHDGVVGNIKYLSPEYLRDGILDYRTDIYAIGVVGYEMLTGTTPTYGRSAYDFIEQRINNNARPIPGSSLLIDIIMKALEKDPEKRYQSATQMAEDLKLFIVESIRPTPVKPKIEIQHSIISDNYEECNIADYYYAA